VFAAFLFARRLVSFLVCGLDVAAGAKRLHPFFLEGFFFGFPGFRSFFFRVKPFSFPCLRRN